jgi:hypothetical protein
MFTFRLVIVLALTGAPAARGDLIQVGASRDNTLYQDSAGALSNGAGPNLYAGRNAAGLIRRGVIGFDIAAAIPAGSTITAVMLRLHVSQSNDPSSIALHRLTADWGEGASIAGGAGGGGGVAASGDATWLHRFYDAQPPLLWSMPGGDYAALPSAIAMAPATGFATWSAQQLIADVQSWLDEPGANFGWILIGDESGPSTSMRFESREHSDPGLHPLLTIEYIPVPAPSACGMLVGGFLLSRRRRSHPQQAAAQGDHR